MPHIDKIIRKIKQLDPIPVIVHRILALSDDPDSNLSDIIDIVKRDPSITANLLKICNSAHMGLPQKVDSVQRAVTLLGMQGVVELVLAQNLGANLGRPQKGYQLKKGDLWKQSVASAMVARVLAQRRQLGNLPAIYTAGLLKDIGKVVLGDFVYEEAAKIEHLVDKKGLSFIEAEHQCLGMDHAMLGGIIARQWNFNSHLIFMIENHHLNDLSARSDPSTISIYLADMVAMMAGTCIGIDRLAYPVYEDIFSDFFLTKDELKALILSYEGYLGGAEHLLEINN